MGFTPQPASHSHGPHWASLLAGSGLLLYGLRKPGVGVRTALGAALVYRGLRDQWPLSGELTMDESVAMNIQRPAGEIYDFCRDPKNLPKFVSFLKEVHPEDGGRSRWSVEFPASRRREWIVETQEDAEARSVSWHSRSDSSLDVEGVLRFENAPSNRGTTVRATIRFHQSNGGPLSRLLAPFGKYKLQEDVRRLKRLMETGEEEMS